MALYADSGDTDARQPAPPLREQIKAQVDRRRQQEAQEQQPEARVGLLTDDVALQRPEQEEGQQLAVRQQRPVDEQRPPVKELVEVGQLQADEGADHK